MYKVGEVADRLRVPSVLIHEKLINNRELLEPYIKKANSITYINERGLEILETLIHGGVKDTPTPKLEEKSQNSNGSVKDKPHVETTTIRTKKDKYDLEREKLLKEIEILFNEMSSMDHRLQLQFDRIAELQKSLDKDFDVFKNLHSRVLDMKGTD